MSSQSEPAAAQQHPKAIVARRKTDLDGIAEFRIPKNAKPGKVRTSQGAIEYSRFSFSLVRGRVDVHIRGAEHNRHNGSVIVARFEVWQRRYSDGSGDLFIDIYPEGLDARPKHKLCVYQTREVPEKHRKPVRSVIPAHDPAIGGIVVYRI